MRRRWVHPLLLTLVASAAGAVLQAYAYGWFAEISPSRIATLPVAILLGPWHGIVAVLLAALSGTIPPVLLAVRVLEAAVVGAAARRGHSPLLAGGLFLLVIAALIGIAPQLYDVPAAGATSWARAMQLLLNRMVPVVVATLLASIVSNGWRQAAGSRSQGAASARPSCSPPSALPKKPVARRASSWRT